MEGLKRSYAWKGDFKPKRKKTNEPQQKASIEQVRKGLKQKPRLIGRNTFFPAGSPGRATQKKTTDKSFSKSVTIVYRY